MTALYVFSRSANGGHRVEYNAVLDKEFRALGVTPIFIDRITPAILGRDIFFAMLDEAPAPFMLCALASLIFRSRTVGLLLRPGECFRRDRIKYRVKYAAFRLLKRMSTVRVLTILPFSVDSRFAHVADDWVYDLQLWDREAFEALTSDVSTPLSREVVDLAGGRALIVALGDQNRRKGFDYLCALWRSSAALRERHLIVAAGQVVPESQLDAEQLRSSGGVVIDRFVSPQELNSLYAISTLIWAAYRPDYDQASGIVGRAYQFGVPVVLRKGSYMAGLMQELRYATIEIGFEDPSEMVEKLLCAAGPSERRPPDDETAAAMHRRFAHTLSGSVDIRQPKTSAVAFRP